MVLRGPSAKGLGMLSYCGLCYFKLQVSCRPQKIADGVYDRDSRKAYLAVD